MEIHKKDLLLELYKAHYTAREVSAILELSYATVQNYFRVFNATNIQKYDRTQLMDKETLYETASARKEAINQ